MAAYLTSYADTAVLGCGHFEDFRPGFRFGQICHDDRHGQFTLKQLRLSVVSEMHTNSYTGPRLKRFKFCGAKLWNSLPVQTKIA